MPDIQYTRQLFGTSEQLKFTRTDYDTNALTYPIKPSVIKTGVE